MSNRQPWSLPRHIPQLDGVRGVACLFVLTHHYFTRFYIGPHAAFWARAVDPFLLSGVDLFFVLSGFLIGGILIDNREASPYFSTFYIRRICRIFPVYFLLIGLFIAARALDGGERGSWLFADPMPVLSYATFTQNFFMANFGDVGARWLGITWSLAVEEQFYLLFPLVVAFIPPRHLLKVAVGALILAPVCRYFAGHHIGPFAPYVLLPCRVDTLMCGVLAAIAVRDARAVAFIRAHGPALTMTQIGTAALLVLSFFGIVWVGTFYYSLFAILYALLITTAVVNSGSIAGHVLKTRALVFTGLISYAIYMYHQAIAGLEHRLLFNDQPSVADGKRFAAMIGAVALTFLAAYVSQVLLERPIRRFGARFRYGAPAPLSGPMVESLAPD